MEPVIRVMMMPKDTNPNDTIFGGVILSYLDQAGAIKARELGHVRLGQPAIRVVTVAMTSVEFKQPVYVGDVVSFYAEILSVGKTSVKIRVKAESARFFDPSVVVPVTEAEMVFVAVNEIGVKVYPEWKMPDKEK